jgi:hypothetical protein
MKAVTEMGQLFFSRRLVNPIIIACLFKSKLLFSSSIIAKVWYVAEKILKYL